VRHSKSEELILRTIPRSRLKPWSRTRQCEPKRRSPSLCPAGLASCQRLIQRRRASHFPCSKPRCAAVPLGLDCHRCKHLCPHFLRGYASQIIQKCVSICLFPRVYRCTFSNLSVLRTYLSCTPLDRVTNWEKTPLGVLWQLPRSRVLSNLNPRRAHCPGGFIRQRVGFYTDQCVSNPSVLSFLLPGYQSGSPQTGHDCLAVHAQCSTGAIPDCLAKQMQGLRPVWCSVVSMSGASPRTPFRHSWWLSPPRLAEFYSDHAPGHQLAAQPYYRSAVAVS
jgi:hypothetical protein